VELGPDVFPLSGAGIGAEPALDNVSVAERLVSNSC
jgi:hypothetical protein